MVKLVKGYREILDDQVTKYAVVRSLICLKVQLM